MFYNEIKKQKSNILKAAFLLSHKLQQQCCATSYSKMKLSCIKRQFLTSTKYARNIYIQPDKNEITTQNFCSPTEERKEDFKGPRGNTFFWRWILRFDHILLGSPRILELFEDGGSD